MSTEYNAGYRDGYRKGLEDFDRKHAIIMAQIEALIRHCAEIELSKPRIIIIGPKDLTTQTV